MFSYNNYNLICSKYLIKFTQNKNIIKKTFYFYIQKVRQNNTVTKVICMILPVKMKVEFPVELTQHEDDKFRKITQLNSHYMEIAV